MAMIRNGVKPTVRMRFMIANEYPPKRDADRNRLSEQNMQHIQTACDLGEHGCNCCAAHAEMQNEDKHRVQQQIQDGA